MMNKLFFRGCVVATGAALMTLTTGTEAKALLIGDSVAINLSALGASVSNQVSTVGAGNEFFLNAADGSFALDVSDSFFDITIDFGSTPAVGAPTTWTLSDLDWAGTPGGITGVSLSSGTASDITGLSFTDNSITVDFLNVTAPPSLQTWRFDVTGSDPTVVPTPAAVIPTLLGLGSAALRKRKKDTEVEA